MKTFSKVVWDKAYSSISPWLRWSSMEAKTWGRSRFCCGMMKFMVVAVACPGCAPGHKLSTMPLTDACCPSATRMSSVYLHPQRKHQRLASDIKVQGYLMWVCDPSLPYLPEHVDEMGATSVILDA